MSQHLNPLEQNPSLSSDPTGISIFTNQVRPDTSKHSVQEYMDKESNRTKRDDHEDAEDSAQQNVDPNIVDWDGPNDAANPQNWSKRVRIGHVALISVITLVT